MIKKVEGTEFQVTKRTITATKLQPEDEVVKIQVVTENQHIVLQTTDGFFLRFPAAEVTEKKKRCDRSARHPSEERRCTDRCVSV